MGHCNGTELGGGPAGSTFVNGFLRSQDVMSYTTVPQPNWRLRRVAIWGCYSDAPEKATAGGALPNWARTFGIRPSREQRTGWMAKNAGLFFRGELPQGGYSGTFNGTSVEVAVTFDSLWAFGPLAFPGGANPTYSFGWAVAQIKGMCPEINSGLPKSVGFPYLNFAGVYDDELLTNNISHTSP